MPASLDSLSLELIGFIVHELLCLPDRGPIARYATVSKKFQVAVERWVYQTSDAFTDPAPKPQLKTIGEKSWRRRAAQVFFMESFCRRMTSIAGCAWRSAGSIKPTWLSLRKVS
ncbi:hypothetical protein BDW69DRAFT_177886 [Aspergillus filifer]